ncbi:hypothetical protein lerEdw1_014857 [Lerista edwardsae]|nr:hypothetical protein lerEdw1_014859 [Lerista edwardsae]KAJ6623024.1 hypothetical protein lerEdw1_014857 [Lerista edwardsae]
MSQLAAQDLQIWKRNPSPHCTLLRRPVTFCTSTAFSEQHSLSTLPAQQVQPNWSESLACPRCQEEAGVSKRGYCVCLRVCVCGRVGRPAEDLEAAMGTGMSKMQTCGRGALRNFFLLADSEDRENLAKHKITHILSVHNNAKPLLEDISYLCISASDSSSQNLIQHFKECIRFIHECRLHGGGCLIHCLAGVSRSTTILVAYLMTVTNLGWEECLAATKAVRSYVSPNFGFQQQLQEYETTLLQEHRAWIRQEYGKNPLNDQEELQHLLSQQEEKVKEQQAGLGEMNWVNAPSSTNAASSSHRWMNR